MKNLLVQPGQNPLSFVLWGAYAVIVAVQLASCQFENLRLRASTKGFVVASLSACYLLLSPAVDPIFTLALILCLLGDMLLLTRSTFEVGGLSFFLGHLLFVLCYTASSHLAMPPLWFTLSYTALLLTAACFVIRRIRAIRREAITVAAAAYLAAVAVHSMVAAALLFTQRTLDSALIFAGTVSFFLSDCVVVLSQFRSLRHSRTTQVIAMSTYILAMTLIVAGYMAL